MLGERVSEALSILTAAAAESPGVFGALHARWRRAGESAPIALTEECERAADVLDEALPEATRWEEGRAALTELFGAPEGEIVLIWCAASAARRDARMAELLAAARPGSEDFAVAAARDRVVEGPLADALACAPLLGKGDRFALPENAEAAARMEILLWEAGASALSVPELGTWIGDRRRLSRR